MAMYLGSNQVAITKISDAPTPESWTRPSTWPDLSQMDVSAGNIIYMTSYADEARGFCDFYVSCTGSYTVELGYISGSSFVTESTHTYTSNTHCKLYYGSANGTFKVLKVAGTNITFFKISGVGSLITIDNCKGFDRNQGIIDVVGKLPNCTGMSHSYLYNLINMEITDLVLSGSGANSMFSTCYSLTSVDVSSWDTSAVTNMSNMFINCSSLASLDVSNWDTSKVTTMSSMFSTCRSLTSLDVSNWDTSAVTDMSYMFTTCSSLTSLDISNWDTSKVTTMSSMFSTCNSLASPDVSSWDTSKVTNMGYMFQNCYGLTSLDVSSWDTSAATSMSYMFTNCYGLTSLDVSSWDTSKVTGMNNMFQNCYSLTSLDISSWDTSKVTSMGYMFATCASITSLNVSSWDFSSVTSTTNTFYNCYGLHGSITIPATATVIGANCFSTCRSLYEWHFLSTTPPTLGGTSAFSNMADFGGKKIYVPAASLSTYQSASNWSTYASYMVGE